VSKPLDEYGLAPVRSAQLDAVDHGVSSRRKRLVFALWSPVERQSIERRARTSGRAGGLLWLLKGAEFAREEDQRVPARRGVQAVDVSYDDPVVAGGVLGDDLAL